jgi:TIR domain-containing protein
LADIFISYTKADADKTKLLAALLEAKGYTVWWDTNLAVSDEFTQEIQKQLGLARIVVVIWTARSIRSRYVNAEALYAYNGNILFPVYADNIDPTEIPTPFNAVQALNFADTAGILHGVERQLLLPRPAPPWRKQLRYEFLQYFGVAGTVINLFVYSGQLTRLAEWARWLTGNWRDLLSQIYLRIASLLDISFPDRIVGLITFAFFVLCVAVGSRVSARQRPHLRSEAARAVLAGLAFLIFITISPLLSLIFSAQSGSVTGLIIVVIAPLWALLFTLGVCFFMYEYASRAQMILYGSTFVLFFGAVGTLFATSDLALVDWKSPPSSITTPSILDPLIETGAIVWAFIMLSALLIPCCFSIAPADKLIRRILEVSGGLLLLIVFNKLTTLAGL